MLLKARRASLWLMLTLSAACALQTRPAISTPITVQLADGAADVARLARDSNEARYDALTNLLSERKIAFEVESFTIEPRKTEPRTTGRNIVVTFPGASPEVVVGAHYDAVRLRDGTLSRGAVDNAASAIVLVRLADALSKMRLRRRIRIVFFDMEELGLLGSMQFASAHKDRPVAAMINLDVNAFGDTLIFGPRTSANSGLRQALSAACSAVGQQCLDFLQMPPSDDRSFAKMGIPTLSIATLPEAEAHQLWLLMGGGKPSGLAEGFVPGVLQTIHTAADQVSAVDPAAMALAYRAALTLIANFDGSPAS